MGLVILFERIKYVLGVFQCRISRLLFLDLRLRIKRVISARRIDDPVFLQPLLVAKD